MNIYTATGEDMYFSTNEEVKMKILRVCSKK
jgi:hypothetical protein